MCDTMCRRNSPEEYIKVGHFTDLCKLHWVIEFGQLPYILNKTVLALYKPPRDKTNNVVMRPAKIQISLGIRLV